MDPVIVGVLFIILLFVLLGLGVHIGIAMMAVGFLGALALGVPGILTFTGGALFQSVWLYMYIVLPLFILMSSFAANAGVAEMAYNAVHKWFYRVPGSLAIVTTFGSAVFGAISGSALATAAVFGRIAFPTMKKYGYDKGLSLGGIASAGTFAAMIPPSTVFVLYAIFTQTSVGRLFLAGIIPGLITALSYAAYIIIRCKLNPNLAPIPEGITYSLKEKLASLKDGLPVLGIAIIVLGGIYAGFFTVVEGAAVGCAVTLATGVFKKGWHEFNARNALQEAASSTANIFLIVIGAYVFARFITLTRIGAHFAEWLIVLPVPKEIIILGIFAMFFLLGLFMLPPGIMAITLPVLTPVVNELGFSLIWFGVIVVKAMEIGAVTPPVGLNVYVLKGVVGKDATLEEIYKGIWPFVAVDIIVLIILILFPSLSLWLPELILG